MFNLDVHKVTTRLLRVNTLNSSGYFMYHPVITLKNSAFYPQSIFLCFVKDTVTNSGYFPTQYQQTGFYNRVRLLCGTNRIFKYNSGSNQAFKTRGYHQPPPRRFGFDPSSIHVRFVITKWLWDRSSSEYFRFPLSVLFHQCSKLII